MQNASHEMKPGENTWLWLLKIFSGLFILIILWVHFVVNHFVAPGGLLMFEDVVAYYQNPLIPIMEAFFLVFVILHSLLGVRSILLDLNLSGRILRAVDWFMTLFGLAATGYGIWLLFAVRAYI